MNTIRKYLSTKPWVLPVLIFFVLACAGATMHPLWGDEAETALFARNIVSTGLPKGWDGTNIMGINNGVVLDKHLINHTSPWGQYYLTALSFLVFGESSFTARLPYIVLAVFSVITLYYLVLKVANDRRVAILAVWILSLSVGFLLFAFQSRYYSLLILSGVVLVYSALLIMEKKVFPKIAFIISGIGFFYANYVAFVAFFVSTFFAVLIYWILQKKPKIYLTIYAIRYAVLSAVIALFSLPWYLILKPFESRGEISFTFDTISYLPALIYDGYVHYIINGAFPVSFLVATLLIIGWRVWQKKSISEVVLFLTIPFFFLFIMAGFTLVSNVDTSFTSHRYTIVVFPFFAAAVAYVINIVWSYKKKLGVLVLLLFIFTNVFSLQKPWSSILAYLSESIHPYKTPDKEVADFLQKNAKKGDTAYVNLDRDHEPLIFFLKDKIKFVNRVSLINTRIFPENRDLIPRYVYDFRGEPDWVILYSKRGNDRTFLTFDYLTPPPEVNLARDYTETVLPIYFSDVSRPEFELRSFTEIKPEKNDMVYIYKLKK